MLHFTDHAQPTIDFTDPFERALYDLDVHFEGVLQPKLENIDAFAERSRALGSKHAASSEAFNGFVASLKNNLMGSVHTFYPSRSGVSPVKWAKMMKNGSLFDCNTRKLFVSLLYICTPGNEPTSPSDAPHFNLESNLNRTAE